MRLRPALMTCVIAALAVVGTRLTTIAIERHTERQCRVLCNGALQVRQIGRHRRIRVVVGEGCIWLQIKPHMRLGARRNQLSHHGAGHSIARIPRDCEAIQRIGLTQCTHECIQIFIEHPNLFTLPARM